MKPASNETSPSNRKNWRLEKIEILVQNQPFWNIVGARITAATHNSRRDNAAGILIIWWASPPCILQNHSLHQAATGTPLHVHFRRRGIIITISHGFGTNCMVRYKWDSAPWCVCDANFISDLNEESPIFPGARYESHKPNPLNSARASLNEQANKSSLVVVQVWFFFFFGLVWNPHS